MSSQNLHRYQVTESYHTPSPFSSFSTATTEMPLPFTCDGCNAVTSGEPIVLRCGHRCCPACFCKVMDANNPNNANNTASSTALPGCAKCSSEGPLARFLKGLVRPDQTSGTPTGPSGNIIIAPTPSHPPSTPPPPPYAPSTSSTHNTTSVPTPAVISTNSTPTTLAVAHGADHGDWYLTSEHATNRVIKVPYVNADTVNQAAEIVQQKLEAFYENFEFKYLQGGLETLLEFVLLKTDQRALRRIRLEFRPFNSRNPNQKYPLAFVLETNDYNAQVGGILLKVTPDGLYLDTKVINSVSDLPSYVLASAEHMMALPHAAALPLAANNAPAVVQAHSQPPAPPAAHSQPPAAKQWVCQVCTLFNDDSADKCQVCLVPRAPISPLPPSQQQQQPSPPQPHPQPPIQPHFVTPVASHNAHPTSSPQPPPHQPPQHHAAGDSLNTSMNGLSISQIEINTNTPIKAPNAPDSMSPPIAHDAAIPQAHSGVAFSTPTHPTSTPPPAPPPHPTPTMLLPENGSPLSSTTTTTDGPSTAHHHQSHPLPSTSQHPIIAPASPSYASPTSSSNPSARPVIHRPPSAGVSTSSTSTSSTAAIGPTSNVPHSTAAPVAAATGVVPTRCACPIDSGKYRKVRHVGRGATGDVFLAESRSGDRMRQWALKQIILGNGIDSDDVYLKGQQYLELRHKHLIKYEEVFSHSDEFQAKFVVIVMPFYEKGDITSLIKSNTRVEEKLIAKIGTQVADALFYLHTLRPAPMVHGDVKPENLLWDGDNVVLTDLETSQFLAATYIPGGAGTYPYQSPEQVNEGRTCAKADIWALGCVLYVLATQPDYPPIFHLESHNRKNAAEFNDWIVNALKAKGYGISFSHAVGMAIRPDPKDRPAARTLCDNLTRLL